jgi:DNA-binding MarR family transcriptional regulator
MPNDSVPLTDQLLAALRRVSRAVDLHSRQLAREYGLTGPQALVLRELAAKGRLTVGELARDISLSQATVTDILNRLERRALVIRARSTRDRRRVLVVATDQARELVRTAPPLFQERFLEEFQALEPWEQMYLVSALERIAGMMEPDTATVARGLDGSPEKRDGPPSP